MLVYYFPELINRDRLDKLYFCLNIDNNYFTLRLEEYNSGESYYKEFEPFVFTASRLMSDEIDYYMHSDKFFNYFHV